MDWPSNRRWQTKVLDSWRVTQLSLLRQECVKYFLTTGNMCRRSVDTFYVVNHNDASRRNADEDNYYLLLVTKSVKSLDTFWHLHYTRTTKQNAKNCFVQFCECAFRGVPTRMVHLYDDIQSRYTILVENRRIFFSELISAA